MHPLIPLRNTTLGNVIKALAFGTSLGVMSAGVMTPYVFFSELDPGFFSHNLGFIAVLSILVWHWVYGLFLGLIYNPLPDQEVIQSQLDFGQALESRTTDGGRDSSHRCRSKRHRWPSAGSRRRPGSDCRARWVRPTRLA